MPSEIEKNISWINQNEFRIHIHEIHKLLFINVIKQRYLMNESLYVDVDSDLFI